MAIKIALRHPLPRMIPTSPPASRANNYFAVELFYDETDRRHALVEADLGHAYKGIFFNEAFGGGHHCSILKPQVSRLRFKVRHYYHGYEISTHSALLFILQQSVRYPFWAVTKDKARQYLFNRKTLVRYDRIELLRVFVQKTTDNRNYAVDTISLLQDLYSYRGFGHPQRQSVTNHYRLILKSFSETGDLAFTNGKYSLTGQGVATLAQYELEERRFKESIGQQKLVGKLTLVVIFVGILQALATYFAA
ncbi:MULTISPECIES: hypothetical protein [Agrobacterium]|uniref:hypothetical protein n=1 Tax=Agrobacterium TaxID=357 RepID=UPI000745A228|nr:MULTISPECIES: hypothetical protein [Agrobacterium]KVK60676.1 hypothetical protein L906_07010 [Agrobacterium sp. TS45]NSX85180.1 hypothetical protein [Agrobacterium tumefaciens]